MPPEPSPVRPAFTELVALAAAVRADWDEAVIAGTLRRAADDGMTWAAVLVKFSRVIADPGAMPRDLLPGATDPTVRRHPDPEVARRGAEAARVALDGGP